MNKREQLCAAQHFGYWMAEPKWLNATVAAWKAGDLKQQARKFDGESTPTAESGKLPKQVYLPGDDPRYDTPLYTVDSGNVAYMNIDGQITKGQSSFGGTSSVRTRQALRTANTDSDVSGIFVSIDSPGGTVSGQGEFSDEIYRIRRGGKPIHAHASGGMHSAALWAGVQAGFVSADSLTEIGSIGVVCAVHDYSEMYAKEGVKVHVVSTGDMKGAYTPGTEVTDDMLAELQSRVEELNGFFMNAIKRGRNMGIDAVRALADGRDWLAADAKAKGLIDEVMSYDDALANLRREIRRRSSNKAARSRAANRRIALAEKSS